MQCVIFACILPRMKPLFAFLALSLPALANEPTVLREVTADLDRDGRADIVRIVETPSQTSPTAMNRTLTVTYSKSRISYTYDGLLTPVDDSNPSEPCLLRKGPPLSRSVELDLRASGRTVTVISHVSTGCGPYSKMQLTLGLSRRLMVERAVFESGFNGRNGDRERHYTELDFVNRQARQTETYTQDSSDNQWSLPRGCELSFLEMIETGTIRLPGCAARSSSH